MPVARSPRRKTPAEFPYRLTHPERVVYPESDITKGQIAAYYLAVADHMLPHVVDRPLSLVRCPEGRAKQCFFQKHPPTGISEALGRVEIREKSGLATYLTIQDTEGLLALVQFGGLEVHLWGSRADDLEHPDRIIFDLDPGPEVEWSAVVDGALTLRDILAELGLESFCKTTGGKGLHVVLPIVRKSSWAEVKDFSRSAAEFLARMNPARYLVNMSKAQRTGKIFVDYLRNERGATAVAPFSTRARPSAPVATPVSWRELRKLSGGNAFTIANVPQRLKSLRTDPWQDLLKVRQTLKASMTKALARA
jgi:bifunctional non-homologous end joining protein LigD